MKYIIEIPDDVQYVLLNGKADNKYYTAVRPIAELEELNSDYINEHYGSLQDEAYKQGYADAERIWRAPSSDNEFYQKGLEDAWKAARRIAEMTDPPYWEVFNEYKNDLFGKITASEAIEKLKAYDDKQKDRIEVGDEVEDSDGDKTIVTNIHSNLFDGLCSDGSVMSDLFLDDNHKTGKHYDIASILEAMRTHD